MGEADRYYAALHTGSLPKALERFMKIYVDFSIFAKSDQSLGHVSGEVEVSSEPRVGELLALPGRSSLRQEVGIPAALRVEHIIQSSFSTGPILQVALEDVTLERAYSLATMDKVIEEQMSLIWNPHDLQ